MLIDVVSITETEVQLVFSGPISTNDQADPGTAFTANGFAVDFIVAVGTATVNVAMQDAAPSGSAWTLTAQPPYVLNPVAFPASGVVT